MTAPATFVTQGEAETEAAGRDVAASLQSGAVLLLSGPLGAGKTAFVRGLIAGLGGDPAGVSSPTFTIIQEYAARLAVHHVDLYRLNEAEARDLGLDELIETGVTAVEWPERWPAAPPDARRVTIAIGDGTTRVITVNA